jgi:hypothetical protein
MHLGGMKPHIYRMAKTFTGDVVFDQLVAGYYSLLAEATANSAPMATTTGLVPGLVVQQPSSKVCPSLALRTVAIDNDRRPWWPSIRTWHCQ